MRNKTCGIRVWGPSDRIAPQFDKRITRVDCSYNSINGPVIVNWQRKKGRKVRIKVEIPANSSGTIYLPSRRIKGGRTTKNNVVPRMKVLDRFSEATVVDLVSGKYKFRFNQMQ